MSYLMAINLLSGAFLLSAVLVLLRRDLAAVVRVVVVQGVLLAAVAMTLGLHLRNVEMCLVAVGVLVLKAGVVPWVLRRAVRAGGDPREARPLVNVPSSMVAATLLALVAFVVSRPLVQLTQTPAGRAVPVGVAVVLLGFFALVSRRRALSQVVGILLLDNGISATAFLLTGGVPLIVELGVSLDVLLVVIVLQVLTARMQTLHGRTDLDELRELHDS
jgi:hydrogenase-4 component E